MALLRARGFAGLTRAPPRFDARSVSAPARVAAPPRARPPRTRAGAASPRVVVRPARRRRRPRPMRRVVAPPPRASSKFPPPVDDADLLAGDVTVLWLYALADKIASVVASASFPGWLAPARVDAASLAAFLARTAWLVATWTVTNAALGAYELRPDGADSEEGEMRAAVTGAARAWAAWCPSAALGLWWLERRPPPGGFEDAAHSSFPPGVTLGVALGVVVSWRAYVKVVGLLGWWRGGRERSEKEEEDWGFLFRALGGAAVVAGIMSAAETVRAMVAEADALM
jgi:hypothetical protein